MPNIGKRIREKRESMGITQEDLAEKLGYKNKSTIAKIENGTNDIVQSKVVEFANALNTTVAYLMGWENDKLYLTAVDKIQRDSLLSCFNKLNTDGKSEALKRIEELTYIPKYTDRPEELLNAAHAIDGASEEEKQHDDDIMDNDEFWK
ncbi:helix-turn-helix domain-containing protein [Anaerocolumna jejuensis]|uniref:helix-turn-helix domain-containing protein n=1 Tax=Anaerocolumna jejuensis TaxID=259063 RepID=UPI003F7BA4D0